MFRKPSKLGTLTHIREVASQALGAKLPGVLPWEASTIKAK
jgi:hypothetical protein